LEDELKAGIKTIYDLKIASEKEEKIKIRPPDVFLSPVDL
jgi:hypothetical protein